MKHIATICVVVISVGTGFSQHNQNSMKKNETAPVTCKLTTPELQERKKTVIAEVKKLIIEKSATEKGARYKFDGSDKAIDLLTSFIKTERLCCDFFTFNLVIGGEENFVWLELSGPEGTKGFIAEEIGF